MLYLIVILGLVCVPTFASQPAIVQPYQVTISGATGNLFGDVTVEITAERKVKSKITSIRLKIDGKWKDVPKKAFDDLVDPLLNETEIQVEGDPKDNKWLYICFKVFYENKNKNYKLYFKEIRIIYHQGSFEERQIVTPISESESAYEGIELWSVGVQGNSGGTNVIGSSNPSVYNSSSNSGTEKGGKFWSGSGQ